VLELLNQPLTYIIQEVLRSQPQRQGVLKQQMANLVLQCRYQVLGEKMIHNRGDGMYQDYSQLLQWVQMTLQTQEHRIAALEQTIQKLQEEMKQLKEKPTIRVDKIEYKFDQLKVETLDGTLNIGLNPTDLANIEDFAVQNQTLNTPIPPKAHMQRSMKIEESIYQYLEMELPTLFKEIQNQLNVRLDDSYLDFIKQDIMKQLPARIDYHLQNAAVNNHESEQSTEESIIELLKQEIRKGILIFINHLPENVKGMSTQNEL
jgi:spore germination protein PC